MSAIDSGIFSEKTFKKAIELCDSKISLLKNKPEQAEKFKKLKNSIQETEKRQKQIIEKTKTIKLVNPTDPNKPTFFDEYIAGKENIVSLCWLGSKLNEAKNAGELEQSSIAVVEGMDFKTKAIDPHYDFVDRTKSVMKQFLNGTGVSKQVAKGCIFAGLGELLSRGVTGYLAQEGIMQSAMGLVGLGKLGISQLPKLLPILQTGLTMVMGLPQLTLIAGGALAIIKGVPMIKKHIDKVKKKFKNANAFDKGMSELMNQHEQDLQTLNA